MTKTGRAYNPPSADAWKSAVREEWAGVREDPFIGAVIVRLEFVIERPAGHWTKDQRLRAGANVHHVSKPDVDNLAKSTLDALENVGAIPGDAAVTGLTITKRYGAFCECAGCQITLTERD